MDTLYTVIDLKAVQTLDILDGQTDTDIGTWTFYTVTDLKAVQTLDCILDGQTDTDIGTDILYTVVDLKAVQTIDISDVQTDIYIRNMDTPLSLYGH